VASKNPSLRIVVGCYLAQAYAALNQQKEAGAAFSETERFTIGEYADPAIDVKSLSDRIMNFYVLYADFLRKTGKPVSALLALEHAMIAADDDRHSSLKQPLLQMTRA